MPLSDQSLARAEELIARYPQRRSALLPILFLLQAEDGYVSPAGVAQVAELLEALRRDEVPPPTFAADGSVTEPSTAALHWRLAGLGDPPAGYGATAAAEGDTAAPPEAPAAAANGQPAARRVGREPSPPEPTEQREAGEPQPEEGAGAAAPEAPTEPEPQDAEAAHEAPGDEGPAPEEGPRPQAGEGR